MTANSSKIQAHDPAICEYSCIIFIDLHVTLKRPGNLDSLFSVKKVNNMKKYKIIF